MDHREPAALLDARGGTPTLAADLVNQVSSVVLGASGSVRLAVAAFLAGGHVLVEDVPGVGKTLLAKALARSIGGSFGRIQGTSDLMPTDVTGVEIYDLPTGAWNFRPGPIFNHVVLIDEINRATPRTQSALLESMGEQQVTADGRSRPLPTPFFVIATQNPRSDPGTFPLLPGQRDRFGVVLSLGQLDRSDERALLRGAGGDRHLDDLRSIGTIDQWTEQQSAVDAVEVRDEVVDYILDICAAVRSSGPGAADLSPRAALMLQRVARAIAVVDGRTYVAPDDVKAVAAPVLGHRLETDEAGTFASGVETVVSILGSLPAPVPR